MRTPITLAVAVLAALATAAPAVAQEIPPPLPHNDTSSTNWQSVLAYEQGTQQTCQASYTAPTCPVQAVTSNWKWNIQGNGWTSNPTCQGGIEGQIGGAGALWVSEGSMSPNGWNPWCEDQVAESLPWNGPICAHIPTGEIWVRQRIDFTGTENGLSFGQLLTDTDGTIGGVMYGDGGTGNSYAQQYKLTGTITYSHSTYLAFGDPGNGAMPRIEAAGAAGSCPWPEV